MKIITYFILLFIVMTNYSLAMANNIINNPRLLYQMQANQNPQLDQKISVGHQFHGINELVAYLNHLNTVSLHFRGYYLNDKPLIWINMDNVTIRQLLDQASRDFGYSWHVEANNVVVFTQDAAVSYGDNVQATWQVLLDDSNIHNTLQRWCKTAGWQLVWNVNANYPINNSWVIQGNFKYAVNQVLIALSKTRLPLYARLHMANKVLEIYSQTK